MMCEDRIATDVKKLLSSTFKLDPNLVNDNANLKDDLGLDSVDIMDSVGLLEEQFKIKLIGSSDWASTTIKTVGDLTALIKKKMSEKIRKP